MPSSYSPAPDPAADPMLDGAGFQRLLHRASGTLLVALGVPVIVLLGLVVVLQKTAAWVDHTDHVISELYRADKLLVTMQASFRGYRLANDERLLAPFTADRALIGSQLDEISLQIADNPKQVAVVARVRVDLDRWLAFVDQQLSDVRSARIAINDPSFLVNSSRLFDQAESHFGAMIAEEERLRISRNADLTKIVTVVMIGFGAVALLGIPVLSFWLQGLLRKVSGTYRASLAATERRATELQVTLRSIGDAVVTTDARGRVEFLNPVAQTLTGWSSEEARGQELARVFEILNEHTRAPVENPVARVLRENIIVGLANHTVLRARDGRERPIEDSAAPIRDENGEVLGVVLVFHDVSAKREAELRLEESEARLRFLNELTEATVLLAEPAQIMAVAARRLGVHLQASRCAYAEVAPDAEHFSILHDYTDGCASAVGDYALSLFGPRGAGLKHGRTLVVNHVDAEFTPDQGATLFRAIDIQAMVCFALVQAGQFRALMSVHQTRPRVWTAAEVALIGEVTERCWSMIDRARAELELRATAQRLAESTERFRVLAEVVPLQVWTARLDGQLDYANAKCADYFGANVQADVLGHAWAQFVHPDDLPVALRAWQDSLASGRRYETEFRLRGKDGSFRWFLVRAEALRNVGGQLEKWFGTNTEIDELKRAQAAAEHANRAKDDFIAALSHELRTPLTPVLLAVAALREDGRLPSDVKDQLGMMERNIALEARLIDDLLDITMIVRGKLRLRIQPCDAHSLIGLAVEIVRDDARLKEITIARAFKATQSGLMVDPARFQQVIWNLLRNAVKFTPRGGRIEIRTHNRTDPDGGPSLCIEVSDSGIGISAAELERIFLPFEQGRVSGDHRFGGIGLGLSIARAIVSLHGGRISAQSGGADAGATFVLELPSASPSPLGVAAAELPARPSSEGETPALRSPDARESLSLLLVEDHQATLEGLSRLLTREGHRVVTTSSVAEALAAGAAQQFDFVVSDLGLPDGTGIELMEQLRARHGLRGIALSGYGMEEDLARSREAGFVAHLVKPVDFAQLRRALKLLR